MNDDFRESRESLHFIELFQMSLKFINKRICVSSTT